ncbi:MAG: hypothetical protein MUF43_04205 [Flavobacterium sp.]|jgi:hypothetical protein|nr:hypothetical protein [Flavobacterium sp.]
MKLFLYYLLIIPNLLFCQNNNKNIVKIYKEHFKTNFEQFNCDSTKYRNYYNELSKDKEIIKKMFNEKELKTANDFYYSAIILNTNSKDKQEPLLAANCIRKASKLNPNLFNDKDFAFFYAYLIDMELFLNQKPQIYGQLLDYPIDTTKISDAERIKFGVPTLFEIYENQKFRKLRSITTEYNNSIKKNDFIALLINEIELKEKSSFNINNIEIQNIIDDLKNRKKYKECLILSIKYEQIYPNIFGASYFWELGEYLKNVDEFDIGIESEEFAKSLNNEPEIVPKMK